MEKIKNVFVFLFIALSIYFMFCFVDIVSDNTTPDPVHNKYNIFVLMED